MSKGVPRLNVSQPLQFFTVPQHVVGKPSTRIHVTTLGASRSFCGLPKPKRGGQVEKPISGEPCPKCFAASNQRQALENERALKSW